MRACRRPHPEGCNFASASIQKLVHTLYMVHVTGTFGHNWGFYLDIPCRSSPTGGVIVTDTLLGSVDKEFPDNCLIDSRLTRQVHICRGVSHYTAPPLCPHFISFRCNATPVPGTALTRARSNLEHYKSHRSRPLSLGVGEDGSVIVF